MFPNAQDALPLPRRPNVERYKNLAKDLVKACKSDDDDATVDWAEKWVTVLAKQSGVEIQTSTSRHRVAVDGSTSSSAPLKTPSILKTTSHRSVKQSDKGI